MGFEAMETGALDSVVDEIIAAHPDEWQRDREGDEKARGKLTGFFVGEVMRGDEGQGRRQDCDRPAPGAGRLISRSRRRAA